MKKQKNLIFVIIVLLAMSLVSFAQITNKTENSLEVDATAKISITQLNIKITLGVQYDSPIATHAQLQVSDKISELIAYLQEHTSEYNITELQTASFEVHARYFWNSTGRFREGFTATSTVTFLLTDERIAGVVLDQLIRKGGNVMNIEFIVPEKVQQEAQRRALKLAIAKAFETVELSLKTIQHCVKRLVSLDLGTVINFDLLSPPPPHRFLFADKEAAPAPAPIIVPGKQDFSRTVTIKVIYNKCENGQNIIPFEYGKELLE